MSNNQQISEDSFQDIIPKIFLALTSSVVMPAITFVVIVLVVFGGVFLKSIVLDKQELTNAQMFDAISTAILFAISFGIAALVIAAGHVGVLAFPASIVGWRLGLIRWWTSIMTGFILGCLPIALLMFPRKGSSSSVQGVPLVIDGIFTSAGWVDYIQKILFMGFFGVVGGFSFWLTWRFWDRLSRVKVNDATH